MSEDDASPGHAPADANVGASGPAHDIDCGEDVCMEKVLDRKSLASDIVSLNRLNNWIPPFAILSQWIIIAATIGVTVWIGHWALYVLAIFIIGTRQHALAILVHDAAHYRMFTNKTANNLLADVFCAFPVGISTNLYRRFHLNHHRYTNSDRDPEQREMKGDDDWAWPKMRREMMGVFFRDITGINTPKIMNIIGTFSPVKNFWARQEGASLLSPLERISFLVFLAVVVTGVTLAGAWVDAILLWMVPSATVLSWIFRMRAIGEHTCVERANELNGTRLIRATLLERFIIAPFNICYHLDHHLFPSVPFYNLPRLHKRLLLEDVYKEQAHITEGYFSMSHGVLAEVMAPAEGANNTL